MAKPIPWYEELPDCDFCGMEYGIKTPAPYDGKTKLGPWANMCDEHLKTQGYPHSQGLTQKRLIIPNDVSSLT